MRRVDIAYSAQPQLQSLNIEFDKLIVYWNGMYGLEHVGTEGGRRTMNNAYQQGLTMPFRFPNRQPRVIEGLTVE
jgi:hypothetical protein